MNAIRKMIALALAALIGSLVACGGGGSGKSAESATSSSAHSTSTGTSDAQGAYEGVISGVLTFRTIILDNDEYYTLYGTSSNGILNIEGILYGTGKSGNGIFTVSNISDFNSSGITTGSLIASYVPGVSFNGTLVEGDSTLEFAENAIPILDFDYNAPADLSRITGAWSMSGTPGESVALTIASDGSFSGSSAGCTFNGTITPRTSGKNIFDTTVSYGPAPCSTANQSVSGIAIETFPAAGTHQLIILGFNDALTNATIILGSRALPLSSDQSLAQGTYEGTITYGDISASLNFSQQTIVLENGEFFIIYGNIYDSVFLVDGFLHGTGQISGNRLFSSDLSDYFFDAGTISAVYDGSLSASYVPGNSFSGGARQVDSIVRFTGTVLPASGYDYNTAASLANITGNWIMADMLANPVAINVADSGSFTGRYDNGCSFSGTLTPRASGKNVFNATVAFGPAPCAQPGLAFSGIARDYLSSSQNRTLVIAGITADSAQGTTLFGRR